MTSGPRAREVLREAVRDVRSGTAWAATFALLFAVIVGGPAIAFAMDRAAAVRAATAFLAAGGATRIETADGRVDGVACDALVDLPNVRAAGAIRRGVIGAQPATLPRSALPTFAVSPGFAGLLDLEGRADASGLVVSADVAADLGVTAESEVVTATGRTSVQGVYRYPDDGRDPVLAYAVLTPTGAADTQPFDACWATSWPEDESLTSALGRTLLPATGADDEARPSLSRWNSTLGARFVDPTIIGSVAADATAFIGGVLLGVAFVLRRRLLIASDRHVGMPVVGQCWSMLVQAVVWTSVGGAVVLAVIGATVREFPMQDSYPIATASGTALLAGVVGVVLGVVGGVVSIREQALFRYFKQR